MHGGGGQGVMPSGRYEMANQRILPTCRAGNMMQSYDLFKICSVHCQLDRRTELLNRTTNHRDSIWRFSSLLVARVGESENIFEELWMGLYL